MSAFYHLFRVKTHFTNCLKYHTINGVYGHKPKPIQNHNENCAINNRSQNANIFQLVNAFRNRGHLLSRLDPLNLNKPETNDALEIDLSFYESDNCLVDTKGIVNIDQTECKTNEIVKFLMQTYCGNVSIEFMHLSDANERQWIANRWESLITKYIFSKSEKKRLSKHLIESELFDNFLTKKFSTVKRYGGEGAETMITFFDKIFSSSCQDYNITDIIIGMPHRGRLNLLANLLNYPPVILFQKMLGKSEFDLTHANGATGDVLSHLFTSVDLKYGDKAIHVSLLPNPSHLEAISPVICGKVRGKEMTKNVGHYDCTANTVSPILGIQVHGDGAFSGQGIIMETLGMANVPHYSVDGSIHLIVNNQISYTTPGLSTHGRSSRYCSDFMKAIEAPVIHVNGEDPESVVKAAIIALEYRQTFRKDIAIDLVCYRQWGHNELDDPMFTNPVMYSNIHSRDATIPQKYANQILNNEEKELIINNYSSYLNKHFQDINSYKAVNTNLKGVWSGITYSSSSSLSKWDTTIEAHLLYYICAKSTEFPNNFNIHNTLIKVFNDRLNRVKEGIKIDWATAEALAFGSLLYQGFNVRISGQDVGRGTFSQRHAILVDQKTGDTFIPLNSLRSDQKGFIEVCNSILSEEAVLGYEYGLSIDSPNNLIIWEAQFGDFFNGAQIILDTFVSSGETKWLLQSGLTLLLPHGYDGAGPEHSSCRIERFLQMSDSKESGIDSDNINWGLVNPSTPSQYFHILRRQMIRNYRKPLIVVSPKILLRHPSCVSPISDFTNSFFKPVLSDSSVSEAKRVVFCSGKHYYTLIKEREDRKLTNIAIIRLEELCPFPANEISAELLKYKSAKEFIWSQEEPQNMGVWTYIRPRFQNIFNCKLKYVGRPPLSAPAVGIGELHKQEVIDIISNTLKIN